MAIGQPVKSRDPSGDHFNMVIPPFPTRLIGTHVSVVSDQTFRHNKEFRNRQPKLLLYETSNNNNNNNSRTRYSVQNVARLQGGGDADSMETALGTHTHTLIKSA